MKLTLFAAIVVLFSAGAIAGGGLHPARSSAIFPGNRRQRESIVPSKALGESCSKSGECTSSYANCSGTCQCMNGFQKSGQICKATSFGCPYGQATASPVKCTREMIRSDCQNGDCSFPPPPPFMGGFGGGSAPARQARGKRQVFVGPLSWKDSCPGGQYCQMHGFQQGPNTKQQGHCCKKPNLKCPVGMPMEGKKCGPMFGPQPRGGRRSNSDRCPFETHFCHNINLPMTPGGNQDSICCPKPCPLDQFLFNDKCYARVRSLGGKCELDEQCLSQGSASCVGGTCQCKSGTLNRGDRYCERATCPGKQKFLDAVKNANGEVKECSKSSDCGSGAYCVLGRKFCCPVPEPFCVNNPSASVSNANRCNPREGRQACGDGKVCLQFYADRDATNNAVCCDARSFPRPIPLMPEGGLTEGSQNGVPHAVVN